VTSWIGAWGLLTRAHAVQEIAGSNPDRGSVVGVINTIKQLARFFPPNMPSIVNSEFVYN